MRWPELRKVMPGSVLTENTMLGDQERKKGKEQERKKKTESTIYNKSIRRDAMGIERN